jgi:hypothetical protein
VTQTTCRLRISTRRARLGSRGHCRREPPRSRSRGGRGRASAPLPLAPQPAAPAAGSSPTGRTTEPPVAAVPVAFAGRSREGTDCSQGHRSANESTSPLKTLPDHAPGQVTVNDELYRFDPLHLTFKHLGAMNCPPVQVAPPSGAWPHANEPSAVGAATRQAMVKTRRELTISPPCVRAPAHQHPRTTSSRA